jgi:hypothetical protein
VDRPGARFIGPSNTDERNKSMSAVRVRAVLAATSLTVLTGLSAGCWGPDRICRGGEHPVKSIEYPESGRACVKDGDPPPPGYEEYPPGRVPVHVGDKHDV